jgi:hypothetical protein
MTLNWNLLPRLFTIYIHGKEYCYGKMHRSRCRKKLGMYKLKQVVK